MPKRKMSKGENGEEAAKKSIETEIEEMKAKITKALYQAVYELDESSRAIVLRKTGSACARAVRAFRE